MNKRSTKLKWIGLALAGLGMTISSSAMANMKVESDGGLKVYDPADSAYWFSVGGRLDFDETFFSGNYREKGPFFPNGGHIRRAFVKFMGGVGEYFTYNFTASFTGSLTHFEDAWLNYSGFFENTNVRLGHFTPLATIDEWGNYGTINDTVFLESALATTAFSTPRKAIGLWVDTAFLDMFTVAVTAYQPRQNPRAIASSVPSQNNYYNPNRSDRLGVAARITFVPYHTEYAVFHIGALGRFQSMNNQRAGAPIVQKHLFATRPEARARFTSQLVNIGDIRAKSYNVAAAEILGIYGPFMVESEYFYSSVQRVPLLATTTSSASQAGNVRFHGWHVQAGYMLTGETRGYDFPTGTIQNPSPASTCGAWEVAARYSYVDLTDKDVRGGSEHNTTIGLNWFINDNVRLAFNYIRANIRAANTVVIAKQTFTPVNKKRQLDIFGMRLGVQF